MKSPYVVARSYESYSQPVDKRCVVCGKPIETRERAYQISTGTMKPRGLGEKKLWGHAHHSCFAEAVDSPKAVLSELRRVASDGTGAATG